MKSRIILVICLLVSAFVHSSEREPKSEEVDQLISAFVESSKNYPSHQDENKDLAFESMTSMFEYTISDEKYRGDQVVQASVSGEFLVVYYSNELKDVVESEVTCQAIYDLNQEKWEEKTSFTCSENE